MYKFRYRIWLSYMSHIRFRYTIHTIVSPLALHQNWMLLHAFLCFHRAWRYYELIRLPLYRYAFYSFSDLVALMLYRKYNGYPKFLIYPFDIILRTRWAPMMTTCSSHKNILNSQFFIACERFFVNARVNSCSHLCADRRDLNYRNYLRYRIFYRVRYW